MLKELCLLNGTSGDEAAVREYIINQIKDYKVIDKYKLRLPNETVGVFMCPNSNCITNDEKDAHSRFKITTENGKVLMKCRYCERVFSREVVLEYNGLGN